MVLINLKIKTLESGDNLVSVDDESPLSEFRTVVQEVTSIEKDSQRLIFRGRALIDDARTLKSYGMENEMAVHVVKRVPSTPRAGGASLGGDGDAVGGAFDEHHHHALINGRNVIVGSLPLERTALFDDSEWTLALIRGVLDGLQASHHFVFDAQLPANDDGGGGGGEHPLSDADFTINVTMRALHESVVDSPARERFELLRLDLRKLAWMVTTVKALFIKLVDSLFDNNFHEPSQNDGNLALAAILQGMHDLDALKINALKALHDGASGDVSLCLADEIDAWNLPEDEAHQQQMENDILMRHIVSADLALFLERLHKIDRDISDCLISRYMRVLRISQNYEVASYTARLLNCFTSAVSRIQHLRAHVYHNISDFGVHVDANPHNRIYPQYSVYEREEPPEANVVFNFFRPTTPAAAANAGVSDGGRNATTTNVSNSTGSDTGTAAGGASHGTTSTPNSTSSRVLSSIQSFLQQQQNRSSIRQQNASTAPLIDQNNSRPPGVVGQNIDMQGFRMPAASTRFNQTSSGSSAGGGVTPPPRFMGGGFRMAHPGSGLTGMQYPLGAGFAMQNAAGGGGLRFMAGGPLLSSHPSSNFRSHQPPTHQGGTSTGIDSEPMDTATNATPSSDAVGRPNFGQRTTRVGGIQIPQSLNLGHALTEFMSLASQVSGGAIPLRSSAGQSSQNNRNRSNPSLMNHQQGASMRRSNSTSRLAGATSENATQTAGVFLNNRSGPIPQPPPPLPFRAGPHHAADSNFYNEAPASLMGWRQWPANSPHALFVGQRPPHAIPLFTNDPNLPCASRRLRDFEQDARHNDFWNDPLIVASGIQICAPTASDTAESGFTHGSSSSTSQNISSNAADGARNGRSASGGEGRSRQNPIDISLNNNGEAIFTEERVFRDYVQRTFERVALSLSDFQVSTPSGRQRQFRLRRQSDSLNQVFGYSPMIGHPFGMSRAGFHSMEDAGPRLIEGIISITAEIPINAPEPMNGNNNGNGGGNGQSHNHQSNDTSRGGNRNTSSANNVSANNRGSGGGAASGGGFNRQNNSDFIDDLEEMD